MNNTIGKIKSVTARISRIEHAIELANKYLETGNPEFVIHRCFRALFVKNYDENNKLLPPHKDWVRNFLIPAWSKQLARAEKALSRLENRRYKNNGQQ